MRIINCFRAAALLALSYSLAPIPSNAQTAATGGILGAVTDATGGLVASAQVELMNTETGAKSTTVAGAQGQFAFPGVPPGTYSVTAQAPGFRTVTVNNVNVQVNATASVNIKLEVGEVSSKVEVSAEQGQIELQTADASVGDVIGSQPLLHLPTRLRQAQELLLLQPGTTPQTGSDNGGSIAGALNDQTTFTLDGIDITDNSTNSTINSDQGARPVLTFSVEATDEFRVAVANANSTFNRGSGGQVSLVQRSGTNQVHGSLFWYTQNSVLNANSWDNNRLGTAKPHVEDNRYGGRVGGPIIRDKTFFFLEYEARRYPETFPLTATVPTASLRQGILQFRDAAGNIVAYNLATSTLCGAQGNQPCDPRGLGMSPTIQAMMALDPVGNNPSGGDGLNTTGFRGNARSPLTDDFVTGRFDHNFNSKWHANASFSYSRDLGYNSSPLVLDIRNPNNLLNEDFTPNWTNAIIGGLTGQLSSTLVNTIRFGDVRNRNGGLRPQLSTIASELALPGTNDGGAGYVAVTPNTFTPPISMSNTVRTQYNNNVNLQFTDDLSWTKGKHLIQAGGNVQRVPQFHIHTGKVGGSVNSLNATQTADSSFLVIPAADRPPTCSTTLTTNCLPSSLTSSWDSLYASVLGLMNDDNTFLVRNGQLQAQPFGTPIYMNALSYFTSFYGQDTWRISPSLTLTAGLSYSFQTPYNFSNQEEALLVNATNNQLISPLAYLQAKKAAADQGQIYNPPLGFLPVTQSGRSSVYNTDYGDVAPRVALAWNPSFDGGILGKVFGKRKTVLRGGFGLYYSRLSSEDSVVTPGLTAGFSSSITTALTTCAASGTPGAGCNATATANPAQSVFRIGQDGNIPIPTFPATVTSPYVPAGNYSELISFGIDPFIKNPRIYVGDFTIQRNVGHGVFLEVGWNGRYGRSLYSNIGMGASPYMFKDSASGQTFAQAYDAVANQLRASQPVTVQPWFENQLPKAGTLNGFASTTAFLASREATFFTTGAVANLFDSTSSSQPGLNALRSQLGLQPYDETSVNELLEVVNEGWSNYNSLLLTLRRTGRNFTFDVNYSFSKSLDTDQGVQNDSSTLQNPLEPGVVYGPSKFDHKQILNALFVYNLPTRYNGLPAVVNQILGGWHVSGIFTALSGAPVYVSEGSQVWGGGQRSVFSTPAVPLVPVSSISTGLNRNVTGSGGVGTQSNPATGGTGLNLFSNPQAALADFGYVQLASNADGYGHPLRGLAFWNIDSAIGKRFALAEHKSLDFNFDFYNMLNHPNYNSSAGSLTGSPVGFGNISSTVVPANRQASSRWIMFGARLEF
ncbi:MAG TPA: carboxypeptidase-like regulatory domain-containing protein [Bryobacteraceae bacterium]|nr:carboxypeptidase-like regulatory domain-containing protein [Bryobacteraceae bacterium]